MNTNLHAHSIIIKNDHLDIFGHVNNAAYLTLLEEARWNLISQHNYGIETIERTQLAPIILEINIKFLKELKAGDEIIIQTQFISYKNKIGKLEQVILRNNIACCHANMTIGLFDLTERKLVAPTPEWLSIIHLNMRSLEVK